MGAELQEGRGVDDAFDWQAPAVAQGISASEARALYRMAVNKTDSDPRQAEELYLGWLEDRRSGQPPRPPGRSTRTKQDGPASGSGQGSSAQQPSAPGRRTLTESLPAAEPSATEARSRTGGDGASASGQGTGSRGRGNNGEGGAGEPAGERGGELPRIDLRNADARRASRDAQAGGPAGARGQAFSELPLGFSDAPARGGVPGAPAGLDAGLGATAAIGGGLGANAATMDAGLGATSAMNGGLGAPAAMDAGLGAPGVEGGLGAAPAIAGAPGAAAPGAGAPGALADRPGVAPPAPAGSGDPTERSGSSAAERPDGEPGAPVARPGAAGPPAQQEAAGPAGGAGAASSATAAGPGSRGAGPDAAPGAGPGSHGAGPGAARGAGPSAGPAAARGAGPAASPGAAGIEGVLLPEAPAALTPAAQARLDNVGAQNQTAATATTNLPTGEQTTTQARGAAREPQAEQDARAGAEVVTEIDTRPPPSPEIEAACERIREVIKEKRPPDEASLVEAKPREMAQEAGAQMSADVESRAGSVRDGYADMQGQPQGQPSRQPVPAQLPPDQVATPAVDAGAAAPDALAPSDVSLDQDVAAQEQRIEGAGMTTEPAQLVQDGPIAEARGGLGELQQMAQADPQKVLAAPAAAVDQAQLDMRTLQASAAQQLQLARSGTVLGMGQHSTQVTGTEEEKRAQVGAQMQAVFQRTQTAVDGLLQPLSQTALTQWETGIDTLSTAFETSLASVKSRIEERYATQDDGDLWDEAGALWNSGRDTVLGLPDWVVEEYDSAEATFADGATALITDISRDVNAVIQSCQSLIQQARRDIDAIVQSLPTDLQAWAQGEATRLGEQLDALDTQVTETQASLNGDLVDRANTAVQEVRTRVHELRVAAGGLLGRIAAAIEEFIRDPFRAIVNGLLNLVGIPQASFWALVDRLPNVISGIAENPMGFANTLMAGVGQGFQQFFDNFPGHIGRSLFQWLFSRIGEAGVTIPPDFSPRSILGLVLDVLGISWDRIRTILARHIGEQNADLLDKAYQVISTLIERGPQGLIDMFVEQLDPNVIVEMLLQTALDYVTQAIITQVSTRILMMLNPAGAILQAIEAIYRVVNWIINNAARIFSLIESLVNDAAAILAGDTSGVANLVEQSLVRLIVPVIDFLADYLGLGGIPEAIRNLILGLQSRVEAILDRVIGFIADRARAMLQSLRGGSPENSQGSTQPGGSVGETIRFEAAGHHHRLWIDASGGRPKVMVASIQGTAEEKIAWMNSRLSTLSEVKQKEASPLLEQATQLAKDTNESAQAAAQNDNTNAQNDKQNNSQTVNKEQQLADKFRRLFELFDLDGNEKKRILVIGELSFEFSANLYQSVRNQNISVVASTANTEHEVSSGGERATKRERQGNPSAQGYSLPQEVSPNQETGEPEFSLRFSMFGQHLDQTLPGEQFDTIIIHAPHIRGEDPGTTTQANKKLMDEIFAAAQKHIKPRGEIHVVGGKNHPGLKAESMEDLETVSYAGYKYEVPFTPRASPEGEMFGATFAETNARSANKGGTAEWKVKIFKSKDSTESSN
jgi:hypothetical protein